MPVSSLWIFARLSLCDTPWVSENVGAMVGPFGRPGNRSHKPRAGQSVNYSVGHVEPLSLLPTLLGFPMIWSKDHPSAVFGNLISRVAPGERFSGAPIEVEVSRAALLPLSAAKA